MHQVFEHSEIFFESKPNGTHGLSYWVHPVQADSIQNYVAATNELESTWIYEEFALNELSQRVLEVFLRWAVSSLPICVSTTNVTRKLYSRHQMMLRISMSMVYSY